MCVFMGSAKASETWYASATHKLCNENTRFNLGFIFVAQSFILNILGQSFQNAHVLNTKEQKMMGGFGKWWYLSDRKFDMWYDHCNCCGIESGFGGNKNINGKTSPPPLVSPESQLSVLHLRSWCCFRWRRIPPQMLHSHVFVTIGVSQFQLGFGAPGCCVYPAKG